MRPGRDVTPNMTDYEAERAAFRLDVPERFNFVLDVLEKRAAATPDGLALLALDSAGSETGRYTWASMARETRRMGNALQGLGVKKGDPLFIMLPRIPQWYVAALGAIRIGAVPMPGTNLLTGKDIEYRIARAEAVAAITDSEGAAKVDSVAGNLPSLAHKIVVGEAPSPGWTSLDRLLETGSADPTGPSDGLGPTAAADPMLLYFTSGTVSYPKMVMHTQASYGIGHTITARYWQDLREGDVSWALSDMGWAKAAWGKLFGQWQQGATVVLMNMGKPDPNQILDIIGRHGVTEFCAPPTLYRSLVLTDIGAHDLSGLRHCVSAGEPLNPEVIRIWEEGTRGLTVYDGYGQTETVNIVANYRCMPVRPGSMGKPTPGFDVRIVSETGETLGAGEEGHIAVRVAPERPVGMFGGYYQDPEATEAAFHGGWYFTGDKGRVDEDGYFWFEGRSDDVITSSAYRIGPFEVESALIEHPAVAEAAVVGKDDPERTQLVTAFVICAPGYEGSETLAAELQEHVKKTTAP
ncbi:MAG TPA: AMP-binding protein, partial [Acidimicrobiia bacterium]|nr:AMP-binding protein [Acidimicrobiia bacterium]